MNARRGNSGQALDRTVWSMVRSVKSWAP
jgi:hypothetical protein